MWLLLLIVLILALVAMPIWPYSTAWRGRTWSYYPSALLAVVLLFLLVLLLFGVF